MLLNNRMLGDVKHLYIIVNNIKNMRLTIVADREALLKRKICP
jgi:hypothetical protein